tara:strand:+ start:486 stop:968 length:483 start_codon:yes stop_codon:yes gene_type:complete
MTLYSYNLNTPETLPDRIVLSSGYTRTDPETFTDAEILDAGYVAAPDKPDCNIKTHKVLWVNTEWITYELNDEEKAEIKETEWRRANPEISQQQWAALKTYRDTRIDMDASKEPMYLLTDVNAWIDKLDRDYIYSTYNETLGQFTIEGFDWTKINPDWTA